MRAVAVVSGGMDSATLLYTLVKARQHEVHALSFDYGQRHKKELVYARRMCQNLGARHDIITLEDVTHLLNSALTNPETDVPEGHYAQETMKATVVPNRNSIMLNIAIGVAVSEKADYVATGVHAGDHPIYPDCRPDFIELLTRLARVANEGFVPSHFKVEAPFVFWNKRDIALHGESLSVPWDETWSCYKGTSIHCGRCSTCVERLEALDGLNDTTEYADTTYWKEVIEHGSVS